MSKPRHHTADPARPRDGSHYLFISLYLVLLAFFILLNSLSTVEERKSVRTIKSVNDRFSNPEGMTQTPYLENRDDSGGRAGEIGGEPVGASFFAQSGVVAKEMLALTEGRLIERGNTLRITLSAADFFLPDSPEIRRTQQAFLERMTREALKSAEGERIDISAVHGALEHPLAARIIPPEASDPAKETPPLAVSRMGMMAEKLLGAGVPAESVHVGISDVEEGMLTLTFSRRIRDKAEVVR